MRHAARCVAGLGLTLLILGGSSGAVVPERRLLPGDRPDSLFRQALAQYDRGQTVDARWGFDQLVRALDDPSPWRAAAELMLARALYRLGDYAGAQEQARRLAEPLAGPLPQPVVQQRRRYQPYARYLLAMIAWRHRDWRGVVEQCARIASDPIAPERLAAGARVVAQAAVAQADSAELAGVDPDVQAFVRDAQQLNRAVGLSHKSRWLAARMTAEALERGRPNTLFRPEVTALLWEVRRVEKSDIRIGVIAPLGGPDSAAGVEIVKGVRFAIEQQQSPFVGEPVVVDARDQAGAAQAMERLAGEPTVLAVIGPLTSQDAAAAASVATTDDVPLVTPTASGEGISGAGPYVFQINTTPGAHGRLLAAVAFDSLGARTAAILSSTDADDRDMAGAFAQAFRRRGGEVVAEQTFVPKTNDYRPQLSQIRTVGLLRDTTLAADIRARVLADRGEAEAPDTALVSLDVTTIDVLLISSGDEQDLISIAAQIPRRRIWARILGTFAWGSQEVRRQAGEDAEGVIFATNYDPTTEGTRRFLDAYRAARREYPTYVAALSYDAASLIIAAIRNGAQDRRQVRDALAATRDWRGASVPITFDADGSNRDMYIRIIRGGIAAPVADWSNLGRPSRWGEVPSVPADAPGSAPSTRTP